MHDPPLCQRWELSEWDWDEAKMRGRYTVDDIDDMHEMLAEEAEYHRRAKVKAERDAERPER